MGCFSANTNCGMVAERCLLWQLSSNGWDNCSEAQSHLLLRHYWCAGMVAARQGTEKCAVSNLQLFIYFLPTELWLLWVTIAARLFPNRHTTNPLYHNQIDSLYDTPDLLLYYAFCFPFSASSRDFFWSTLCKVLLFFFFIM